MEYEIEAEVGLFDPSTNPSLLRDKRPARASSRPARKPKPQRAFFIPEEEQQLG